MDVGREIRRLREARGWSQAKLAGDTGMGVSGISQIETGSRNPSAVTLAKIASALGVEVGDLFPKGQPRLPELVPPGEAYFVPLEEGEEEDTVTIQIHYVRLFEGGEPILKAVRKASPKEVAAMRREQPELEYGALLKEKGFPREQIAAYLAQSEQDEEFIRRELEKMSDKDFKEALLASPGLRKIRDYYRKADTEVGAPPRSEPA